MTKNTPNWREELDKMETDYPLALYSWSVGDWKKYISNLLTAQLQNVVEEIEGKKKRLGAHSDIYRDTYIEAVSDIQTLIKNKIQDI